MSNPSVITVSQLNMYFHSVVEGDQNLRTLYVLGEISNFTDHYKTGHMYFSLKDEDAQIKAVMFKASASRLKFKPGNGMSVLVRARASFYEKDGQLRLLVDDMQPDGIGALHLAYEQLKNKLEQKGYFSSSHKKPLPSYPERIAVITSDTGAAVKDILSVLSRRSPASKVILCPVQVQGDAAPGQIIEALHKVNKYKCADVIILGRGGGSTEDLWAFNDERLAQAIYDSDIPIISAVGHETDFTISDFVSDVRAATPSVGAELCVADNKMLIENYRTFFSSYKDSLLAHINREKVNLENYSSLKVLKSVNELIEHKQKKISAYRRFMYDCVSKELGRHELKLSSCCSSLEAMSPLRVLSRGYALVTSQDKVVASITGVSAGDEVKLRLFDGTVKCEVKSKRRLSERKTKVGE